MGLVDEDAVAPRGRGLFRCRAGLAVCDEFYDAQHLGLKYPASILIGGRAVALCDDEAMNNTVSPTARTARTREMNAGPDQRVEDRAKQPRPLDRLEDERRGTLAALLIVEVHQSGACGRRTTRVERAAVRPQLAGGQTAEEPCESGHIGVDHGGPQRFVASQPQKVDDFGSPRCHAAIDLSREKIE